MANGLFAYILKYSKREQLLLTVFTMLAFPFYYLSLDLPKTIVNEAINGSSFPVDVSIDIAGLSYDFGSLAQIPYLFVLCLLFLALVVVNGGFKYFINVYRGVLGERMLRRMRFQLIQRIMQFPLSRFRSTSQGEFVSMVNQETEPLAAFIGESFSLPLYQGGMMLTILIFMFLQDWKLGIAAIALYPFQGWLIPRLQRQVNELNRQRTIRIRKLAENLAETVAGINEIHANDNSVYFSAKYSQLLGRIFYTRVQIYKKKLFIKFLNSFIGQLTPFFFFLIGGLMVIRAELSFGALIAVLAAYKDLSPPWKELLGWYQRQADYRMKYTLLMEQFDTISASPGREIKVTQEWLDKAPELPVVANNVSWSHADGTREVDGVSLSIDPGEWVNVVGTGNSGKSTLAHIFARLVRPTGGRVVVGNQDVAHLPEAIAGRAVGYIGHDSYLFATSVRDNILLSLKHRPREVSGDHATPEIATEEKTWLQEARLSGNSEVAGDAEWIDYPAMGAEGAAELSQQLYSVLQIVDIEDDLVRYALARTVEPKAHPELVKQVLLARALFKQRLDAEGLDAVVEPFDPDSYNDNASVADNILFGAANNEEFADDALASHPLIRSLLVENDLAKILDDAAITTAATMVELFSDLPPGHEFFELYSFVNADDLPVLKRILSQVDTNPDLENLAENDLKLLRSLPYKLVVARHRLGIIQQDEKEKILRVRKSFARQLDEVSRQYIDFLSPDSFNASYTIGENIIFGRVAFGRLGAADRVHGLIIKVLQDLYLMPQITEVGLAAPSGLAGSQFPVSQQQKLVLARALIKQPKILVVNEGLGALDAEAIERILSNIKLHFPRLSLLWFDNQLRYQRLFNRIGYLEAGKLSRLEHLQEPDLEQADSLTDATSEVRSSETVEEDEKITLFRRIPIFRFLDKPSLQLLASTCETLDLPKGQRLFEQGDVGDALYVVIDGKAGILISNGDLERQVQEYGANEVLGEMALLSSEPRSASVVALTDLALLRLKRDVFISLLQRNGEMGYQILQVVANRFIETSRKLENIVQR